MFRTNCRTHRRNLKENGIELEELLADGGYSSGEALAYLHKKTSTPTSQTSDNTNQSEKVLCSTKKKTITNAQNPKVTKAKLLFKGEKMDSKGYTKRTYRSSETDCKTVH